MTVVRTGKSNRSGSPLLLIKMKKTSPAREGELMENLYKKASNTLIIAFSLRDKASFFLSQVWRKLPIE
jgi:hypothetical protein